jgi:hypothetical protein
LKPWKEENNRVKKILALFFCFTVCGFSVVAGGYTINTPAKKVISEVRTYNWTSAKGWFKGQVTKIIVENYDDKGRPVSTELFYLGEIYRDSILADSLNENGAFTDDFLKDIILMEKTAFSYEDDLIRKTTTNHENNLIRIATVQQEGNRLTETVLRADGSLFYKTVSLLDSDGQVVELYRYNGQEELIYTKVYDYSDQGDVIKISLYNPDGTYAAYISIAYDTFDDKGNWLVRSDYYTYADVGYRPRDSVSRYIEY